MHSPHTTAATRDAALHARVAKKQGEMRRAPGAEMRGLPQPGTDRDVDGYGPWGAGHGPIRHDHRLGSTADDGMWSGRRASNSRPQAWEAGALPTELRPHGAHCTMISACLPSSHGHRGTLAAPSPGTSDRRLWATPFPSVKRGGTEDCVSSDLQHSPDGGRATGLRLTGSTSSSLSWRVQACARSLSRILPSPSWILLLLRPRRRQMPLLPFP